MTTLLALFCLVTIALAVVTVEPDLLPWADPLLTTPVLQGASFRGVAVVLFGLGFVLFFLGFLLHRRTARKAWTGLTALVLLVTAGIHASTMYSRGINEAQQLGTSTDSDTSIVFLTANTKGGMLPAADLVKLVQSNGVTAISLPETSSETGQEYRQALAQAGLEFQQFDTNTSTYDPDFASTVLLISNKLGKYQLSLTGLKDAPQLSIVGASRVGLNGPEIVAVHPIAPLPTLTQRWNEELSAIYSLCDADSNRVILGDFNSTFDHQEALGGTCADAGVDAGVAGLGTWPASLPALLAAPIDRVLYTGTSLEGTRGRVVRIGESDHAGLIVELRKK